MDLVILHWAFRHGGGSRMGLIETAKAALLWALNH
jgi:hypothetical protein